MDDCTANCLAYKSSRTLSEIHNDIINKPEPLKISPQINPKSLSPDAEQIPEEMQTC